MLAPDNIISMKLFAGVDGGGSKTRAVVLDESGAVLGRGDAGPSNISSRPAAAVAAAIGEAVDGALRAAGVERNVILQFGFGLAGVESGAAREAVTQALLQQFGVQRITLVTDARAALAGALAPGEHHGMILIAGTGSVTYGRNRDGRDARAGGLGWLIGDEGSGFWVARRALEAVARAYDGRGPRTKILEILVSRHEICKLEDLIQYVYRPEALPANVAALLPVVLEAARADDEVAKQLFKDAAAELALLVTTVIQKLHMEEDAFRVAMLGGLWSAGDLLQKPVQTIVNAVAPHAEFRAPFSAAEVGAARLAMEDFERIRNAGNGKC